MSDRALQREKRARGDRTSFIDILIQNGCSRDRESPRNLSRFKLTHAAPNGGHPCASAFVRLYMCARAQAPLCACARGYNIVRIYASRFSLFLVPVIMRLFFLAFPCARALLLHFACGCSFSFWALLHAGLVRYTYTLRVKASNINRWSFPCFFRAWLFILSRSI